MRPAATLLIAAWTVLAAADDPPAITLRVYDYAGVPGRTLSKAEMTAQHVFRRAGIDTEWIDCPKERDEEERYPACRKPESATDVILHVVPRSMEGYDVGRKAFGFALPSGHARPARHAYVFFDRVAEAVRADSKVTLSVLLGHVMVHETGHLLLGPSTHSARGIMRPQWQPRDLRDMESGRLAFPSDLVRTLRARAWDRARTETAGR